MGLPLISFDSVFHIGTLDAKDKGVPAARSRRHLPPMQLPLIELDSVTHIGTLVAEDKGVRGSSLEGHGLSVSTYPDEWEC